MTAGEPWRVDSAGRRRRLCDAITTSTQDTLWGRMNRPADGRGMSCAHYAVRNLPDGSWACTVHDPDRKVCQRPRAHSGNPPASVGTWDGVRLCDACAIAEAARWAKPRKKPREVAPPCCLCHGTRALETETGRIFPCLCTPFGRELINGAPDAVVRARLEAP